ncbi:hypothetical protein K6U06_16615 [Acidiferrimicrobium sp. IK]|uniref:D-alanyl-D-alanine carboxypeptidase family protein n=1 Tax=Acidiferrimicrobium sp. IK TaxID=2871700 RepID=UPI0021CB110E|nr:hypothetical protein [Acidiferrimicrobium sp. IK]MCU4185994.1 hypothetical protein [Acidiferrimicrobium sp. IK]
MTVGNRTAPTAQDGPKLDKPARRGRHAAPRNWRRLVLSLAAVVLVVVGVGARVLTVPVPPTSARPLLATSAVLPGSLSGLAWPKAGEAAVAFDNGAVLASNGPSGPVPIASVTKVMTAYVILHDHPLQPGEGGPTLTITAAQADAVPALRAAGESVLDVHAGLVLDEYQALQALLLASADNIADALAVQDGGSMAGFVAKMNLAAAAFGMHATHYADASGLNPGSVSTPADQLRLAKAAMTSPVFAAIVNQRSALIPGVGTITNYNTLVGTAGFQGIKTGSTTPAGGCLLFSVTRDVASHPYTITGIVLGQRDGAYVAAALNAAKVLADSAFSTIVPRTVVAAGQPVVMLTRADRSEDVASPAAIRLTGWPGETVALRVQRAGPTSFSIAATGTGSSAGLVVHAPPLAPPTLSWRASHILS